LAGGKLRNGFATSGVDGARGGMAMRCGLEGVLLQAPLEIIE